MTASNATPPKNPAGGPCFPRTASGPTSPLCVKTRSPAKSVTVVASATPQTSTTTTRYSTKSQTANSLQQARASARNWASTAASRTLKATCRARASQAKSKNSPLGFIIETFKTEKCENSYCTSRRLHSVPLRLEKRRSPCWYTYSTVPCSYVYKNYSFTDLRACPYKDSLQVRALQERDLLPSEHVQDQGLQRSAVLQEILLVLAPGRRYSELFRGD